MFLCVCESCGQVMEDYTPTEKSVDFSKEEMKYIEVSPTGYDTEYDIWNCSLCYTDGHIRAVEDRDTLLEMEYA